MRSRCRPSRNCPTPTPIPAPRMRPPASRRPALSVLHLVVGVQIDGEAWQTYQVPVSIYEPAGLGELGERLLVGRLPDGRVVLDALTDPRAMTALLADTGGPACARPRGDARSRAGARDIAGAGAAGHGPRSGLGATAAAAARRRAEQHLVHPRRPGAREGVPSPGRRHEPRHRGPRRASGEPAPRTLPRLGERRLARPRHRPVERRPPGDGPGAALAGRRRLGSRLRPRRGG